mgnify:CR=1 FL=1
MIKEEGRMKAILMLIQVGFSIELIKLDSTRNKMYIGNNT